MTYQLISAGSTSIGATNDPIIFDTSAGTAVGVLPSPSMLTGECRKIFVRHPPGSGAEARLHAPSGILINGRSNVVLNQNIHFWDLISDNGEYTITPCGIDPIDQAKLDDIDE